MIETVEERFSQNLKAFLKERGMSQKELSEKTGIGRSTISAYTKGTLPTLPAIIQLAEALGVTVDALIGYADDSGAGLNAAYGNPSILCARKSTYGDLARMILVLMESKLVKAEFVSVDGENGEEKHKLALTLEESPLDQFMFEYVNNDYANMEFADPRFQKMFTAWTEATLEKLDKMKVEAKAETNQATSTTTSNQ